jgi:transcriptional regulator with XRE-family HTH domain
MEAANSEEHMDTSDKHTVVEWEQTIGEQIRDARISRNFDQEGLAALANISVATLSNLERGKGSSLKTLIAVARALDRTDWLTALSPTVEISPMQRLRAKQHSPGPRRRVRSTRTTPDEPTG